MPRYSPLPWKKTFRKLPPFIEAGLAKLAPGALCAVGCAKVVTEAELARLPLLDVIFGYFGGF